MLEVRSGARGGSECRRIEWASPHGEKEDARETAGVLLIRGASENTVVSNVSNKNGIGFSVTYGANGNSLLSNVADGNSLDGFRLFMSDGNVLRADLANANGENGFLVSGGSNFNAVT